ncbi:MAG: dolichyl-phosphate beta-glucosyltransferase [Pseudomonadota bacterium]
MPMFNEAHRLEACLGPALGYLAREFPGAEVFMIDDGSRDTTLDAAKELARRFPGLKAKALRLFPNRGKGAAVREGMLKASGEICVFLDADNATPAEELGRLVPLVRTPRTIVIGSRAHKGTQLEQKQPWWRQGMGKTFNLLVRLCLGLPYRDTQCGFKLFGREAAEVCFSRQKLDRFAFDAELLWIAHQEGLTIIEAPVRWRHVEESRVRPVGDSLKMIRDLLRIRWLHRS